jgi:hypothetical protein
LEFANFLTNVYLGSKEREQKIRGAVDTRAEEDHKERNSDDKQR